MNDASKSLNRSILTHLTIPLGKKEKFNKFNKRLSMISPQKKVAQSSFKERKDLQSAPTIYLISGLTLSKYHFYGHKRVTY